MKRKLLLFCTVFLPLCAMAQNAIDNAVEDFKSIGSSHFTSVVERNPKTHKPQRVVKKLSVSGPNCSNLIRVFEREAEKSGTENISIKDGNISRTFAVKQADNTRVYSINYKERFHYNTELTIIIKYNE